jgi:hypothetical protein
VIAVRGRWFPAAVKFPHVTQPWQRCLVIAADDGLHIWRKPAETAGWHAPIDWAATTLPVTQRAARNGFDVYTTLGLVVVTLGSGCRCGSMGRWSGPSWARFGTIHT